MLNVQKITLKYVTFDDVDLLGEHPTLAKELLPVQSHLSYFLG
jgi:hypothetical protein